MSDHHLGIEDNTLIEVSTPACMSCNKTSTLSVPRAGYLNWKQGNLHIQNALPDLTLEEREMLMTGTHPDCWDAMFPEEND